jgi:excisionase family DNA binding protein
MKRQIQFTIAPEETDRPQLEEASAALQAGELGRMATALPPAVVELLREALQELARGHTLILTSEEAMLTTQQAADVLMVTRPTVVKWMEEGRLPFSRVGSHRRATMRDVQKLKTEADAPQEEALRFLRGE